MNRSHQARAAAADKVLPQQEDVGAVSKAAKTFVGRIVCQPKSKILFHQGDPANFVYRVISGVVQSSRVLECGRRQVVAFGFPGDTIGLPYAGMHTETCETLVPSTFKIIRVRFEGQQRHNLQLQDWLLELALEKITELQDHSARLAMMNSMERLAAFLRALAQEIGEPVPEGVTIELPMFREDISDYLGMRVETVCRCLAELHKKGIIDLPEPTVIVILRPDALKALAELS